jgi:hypothetical protein
MEKINTDRPALKKFAFTLGFVFFIVALLAAFRHKHSPLPAVALAMFFLISGQIIPRALKPAYIIWMKLAFILSWINTRIILTVIFYLFITPAAVILKILRKDLLDKKIDKTRQSYWLAKETAGQPPINYERQF